MSWTVVVRPEARQELVDAAAGYEGAKPELGSQFIEEVIRVWDSLERNPFLNSRRHRVKNIRLRYPNRFPYRVIYEIIESENTVTVVAV